MASFEDFPTEKVAQWHTDILEIEGVERVSIVLRDGNAEALCIPPEYPDYAAWKRALGVYARVAVVAPREAESEVLKYAQICIPQPDQEVSSIKKRIDVTDPELWGTLVELVDGRSLMDYFLGSYHLEAAAKSTHDAWLNGKTQDLNDPTNPYQGYGETRLKVRDLSAEDRVKLGIPENALLSQDVYHPLHMPFIDLAPAAKNRNIVPMSAACLALGDFLVDDTTTSEQLTRLIVDIAQDTDPEARKLLNMVTHVAWTASDIADGGRPWSEGAEANYHLYDRLSPAVQDLDTQATQAPISYMRDKFEPISSAVFELGYALFREGGPYEQWWAREKAVLKAAQGWTINQGIVPLTDSRQAEIPSFKEEICSSYASQTVSRYSEERLQRDVDTIIARALSAGHIQYDPYSTEWSITEKGKKRDDDLFRACAGMIHSRSGAEIRSAIATYDEVKERYASAA